MSERAHPDPALMIGPFEDRTGREYCVGLFRDLAFLFYRHPEGQWVTLRQLEGPGAEALLAARAAPEPTAGPEGERTWDVAAALRTEAEILDDLYKQADGPVVELGVDGVDGLVQLLMRAARTLAEPDPSTRPPSEALREKHFHGDHACTCWMCRMADATAEPESED